MTKNNGPERIFAMVNGMSTRLPDGKRQFIGGWSEDSDRPRAIEYVRADAVEELVKALETIATMAMPGQTVTLSQATDIICDVWNYARAALAKATGGASHD